MKGLNAFTTPILLIGGLFYSPLSNSATLKVDCQTDPIGLDFCPFATLKAGDVFNKLELKEGAQSFDLKGYSGNITGVLQVPTLPPIKMGPVVFKKDCTLTIRIWATFDSVSLKEFDNKCPPQME